MHCEGCCLGSSKIHRFLFVGSSYFRNFVDISESGALLAEGREAWRTEECDDSRETFI